MIDLAKLKKIIVQIIKILIVLEFVGAFVDGFFHHQWERLGTDLLLTGILVVIWKKAGDRITQRLYQQRDEAKLRMEQPGAHIRVWDAFIFSLLWTDRIYAEVPPDRQRLVIISYTLIGLGLWASFSLGGPGFMTLIVAGALVLAATNLLLWVVTAERGDKQALQTELELAHDVQLSLMPKESPVLSGFDIAGASVPAREVGGDHFDYTMIDGGDQRLALTVFDVSGKGMAAAMSAVFTSGACASELRQGGPTAAIVARLNNSLAGHVKKGQFVAFLMATIDVGMKTMTLANAGQTKPLLKSGSTLRWLEPPGPRFPLGLQENVPYEDLTVGLQSGDVVFFLTDGYTEAMNELQETYGDERMERAVSDLSTQSLSAEAMLQSITAEVRRFSGAAPQHDDMTLVVVKVL